MKLSLSITTFVLLLGNAQPGQANPALLPSHPGYPASGEFSNDPGQKPLTVEQSLKDAAAVEDARVMQKLNDPNNARVIQSQGAGRLPIVEGPQITIEPFTQDETRRDNP
jgi:hypothetical protein